MKDISELLQEIKQGRLVSATLSSPWNKTESLLRLNIRPIQIKGSLFYQVTNYYKQQVKHQNISPVECVQLVERCLKEQFKQGIFTTFSANYHVLISKQKEMTIVKKEIEHTEPLSLVHNKPKKHILQEGTPIPFLVSLGIMSADGKVIAKKYDKFKQINRFVELVSDILPHLPKDKTIEIIDFGCGKASLTFALYHYLRHIENKDIKVTGLDLKREVIENCQALADRLGYNALKFEVGDIHRHQPKGKVDLVISLHACDTATDAALEKAVKWDADVILCVPCCQHELYKQVESKPLDSLLRHGILRERFAALATDAARAELLVTLGYDVQVLEFIDMEHTPKNLMLRAVKDPSPTRQKQAKERYLQFKNALKITPCLEGKLLELF